MGNKKSNIAETEKTENNISIKDLFNLKDNVNEFANRIFKENILKRKITEKDISDLVDIILFQEELLLNMSRRRNI